MKSETGAKRRAMTEQEEEGLRAERDGRVKSALCRHATGNCTASVCGSWSFDGKRRIPDSNCRRQNHRSA